MSALNHQRQELIDRLCPVLDELGVSYFVTKDTDELPYPIYLLDYGSADGMGIDVLDAPSISNSTLYLSRVNHDATLMSKKNIREALKDWGYFGART